MAKNYATFELSNDSKKMLDKFNNLIPKGTLQQAAGVGADIVRDKAIELAPLGLTGNLKAGIVSKVDTKSPVARAYVTNNPKIAPHAHLVEYGTKNPRVAKKVSMYDSVTGTWFGGEVAPMPKKPFMRLALAQTREQVIAAIDETLQRGINKKIGK